MKTILKIGSVLMILLAFFSCETNKVYNDYHQIPEYKWKMSNNLKFDITITDTITPCNIYFNVRNSGEYPYRNLWLFVKERTPQNQLVEDKFNCILANRNGRWLGKGFGDIFDLQLPYKKNVVFKKSGVYTFEISQGMRDTILNGIVNMGILIEKIKK